MTFRILGILALSVFAMALTPLLARAFYALHNTLTPLMVSVTAVGGTIATIALLLSRYDVYAIALGFATGALINFLLLFVLLERRLRHRALTQMHNAVLGALAAMVVASAVTYGLMRLAHVAPLAPDAFALVGFGAVWLALFTFCATLLRVERFYTRVLSMTVIAGLAVQVTKFVVGTVTDLSTFGEVFAQLVAAGGVGMGTYLFLGYVLGVDEFLVLRARVITFILRRNVSQDP